MSDLLPALAAYNSKTPLQALEAALATVQTFCEWHVAPAVTTSLDLWSPDGSALFVPTLYLTAVNTITQDSVSILTSNVTFERHGTIQCVPGKYFSKLSKVTVNVTHGYAALPTDVKDVVLKVAQRMLTDTRGLVPRVTGGPAFLENRGPRLEASDKEDLAPYVLGGFA